MMKKLEEPFFSYWTSPHPMKKEKLVRTFDTDRHEDVQYRELKEAIQLSLSQKVKR